MEENFLTTSDFAAFLKRHDFAVVLFDAPSWDRYFDSSLPAYKRAKEALGHQVGFGIVDVDRDGDLAKSVPIANVPCVVYYQFGKALAVLVGASQNIKQRTRRIMAGLPIGYQDGLL